MKIPKGSNNDEKKGFFENTLKPIVLILTGYYLPGFKAGGILHNIVNTVNALNGELDFRIVTRDRDLGDDSPYKGIKVGEWQKLGNAMVYYLAPDSCNITMISKLISETPHDMLYLTSFLDVLTIFTLICRKLSKIPRKPIIVEPNGEFGWASLKQKFIKKIAFICVSRFIGLYRNVTWRAASDFEKQDIINYMKTKTELIHVAGYLPEKDILDISTTIQSLEPHDSSGDLKLVFISRIVPEKNLDYALRILKRVQVRVVFDIYGPIEKIGYWKKCESLIAKLPENIKVNYLGKLEHGDVKKVFGFYDMFFFPSAGEAYGIVIAESLAAGTPVLTSDKTAWRGLQSDDLGWDIALKDVNSFVKAIDQYSHFTNEERAERRQRVKENIVKRLLDPAVIEKNRRLFMKQLLL